MARINDIHERLLQGPVPVDGNAARSIRPGGEQPFNQWGGLNQLVFEAPPPVRRANAAERGQFDVGHARDFAGLRFGHLRVLGILDYKRPNKKQNERRWVCRCDCGLYIIRTGRALGNETGADRCPRCVEKHKRRTGKNLNGSPRLIPEPLSHNA